MVKALASKDDAAAVDLVCREWLMSFCCEHNSKFIESPHLFKIADQLQRVVSGECKRLIINLPPRHGKSFMVAIYFVAWYFLVRPDVRIGYLTSKDKLSKKHGAAVRDLIRSPFFQRMSGATIRDDTKAKDDFLLDTGAEYRAATRTTGFMGEGLDCLIIDDIYKSEQDAYSAAVNNQIQDDWESSWQTRLEPGGSVIVINTRWHPEDFVGWLLKRDKDPDTTEDWHVLSMPAISDDGEALFPERWDIEYLRKKQRGTRPEIWAGTYQQQPITKGGNLFKSKYFMRYDELPNRFTKIWTSADLTFKGKSKTRKRDFVVFIVGMKYKSRLYITDVVREKMSYSQSKARFRKLCADNPKASAHLIESAANGAALESDLKREISGLRLVTVKGSKEERAELCVDYLIAGNVYLPKQAPWLKDFLDEIYAFPNGLYDDQVDAFTQLVCEIMQAGSVTINTGRRN